MGIDIYSQIKNVFYQSILNTVVISLIRLWPVWLILLVVLFLKFFLSYKLKIHTLDDLVTYFLHFMLSKNNIVAPERLYVSEEDFPTSFAWLDPYTFVFGKAGSLCFRRGKNFSRDVFQILTEEKGGFVRVAKISSLINKDNAYTRSVLTNLSKRIKKVPELSPYIDILASNEGEYRLAIKRLLLD